MALSTQPDANIMFTDWGDVPDAAHPADKNADGVIDAADAAILFTDWTGDVSRIGHRAVVPEPSGRFLALLGFGAVGLLRNAPYGGKRDVE